MAVSTIDSTGIAAAGIARSNMYTGAVLQVVQTQLTTVQTFAPGAGVFTNITGASVTITPTSSSSKILIYYTCFMANSNNSTYWMQFAQVTRNGTAVAVGTQASYKSVGAANYSVSNQYGGPLTQMFLDSPASSSSVTYQLQGAAEGAGGFSIGGSYTSGTNNPTIPTTIIAAEITG